MTMDANYKPFHPTPNKPAYKPPLGAVDAHCHVFGPEAVFPYAPERKYTPCDAPKERLFALRDFLGFDKNVIVQATCHGKDNRAMVDAMRAAKGKARGVATVGEDISTAALKELDEAGVRGVRFNFVKRLADYTPLDVLMATARKIEPLGWHVVVYFEAPDLAELAGGVPAGALGPRAAYSFGGILPGGSSPESTHSFIARMIPVRCLNNPSTRL